MKTNNINGGLVAKQPRPQKYTSKLLKLYINKNNFSVALSTYGLNLIKIKITLFA